MHERQKGLARLPGIGILVAGVCLAAYLGWLRQPTRPALTPESSTSVSVPRANAAPAVPIPAESFAGGAVAPEPLARKTTGKRTISGKVVQTSDYCGGAAPTQEMIEFLKKEKPFPHKELFIRPGTLNRFRPILQKFVADAEGNFKIALPPGDYCLVEESKKDEPKIPESAKGNLEGAKSRAACFEEWYRTCDNVLKVGKQNLKGVLIKFHHQCHPPCVTGLPPPV